MTFVRTLSVRSKILLTIVLCVVALSLAIYGLSRAVLLQSYLEIEYEGMREDLRRAEGVVAEFRDQQMVKLSDWGAWTEAYDFARTRDRSWSNETVYATGLANLDINAMVWSDTAGEVFYLMEVDIPARVEIASSTLASYFAEHKELLVHESLTSETRGLGLLPNGPAIVVSLPLRTSEGEGPSTGALAFMRYLDADQIAEFSEITQLSITAYVYDAPSLPDDVRDARRELSRGVPEVIAPISQNAIVGYTTVAGFDGEPLLILRVETDRPIYAQGMFTFYVFMGIGAIALLLFGIVIVWLLERLVITRFVLLTEDVDAINEDQNLSMRVDGGVKDEIGKLADKINQMLSWLSASREEAHRLFQEVKQGRDRAEEVVKVRTKELFEEKARLLASIRSLSFGFVIAGTDGQILLMNPSLSRILGLLEEPKRVKDISNRFADFDLSQFCDDSVTRQVPTEKTDVLYGRQILRILCAPIFSETTTEEVKGTIIGYVLLIEDITETRAIERSREEFFSIASHELRTPLTAIRGNTDLLLDTYKDRLSDPEMRAMLEDINASSARLISMVNDFLQVSRLEQGKMEIHRQPFDLSGVIEQSVRSLSELANKKGLTLSYAPSALPQVLGDRDRIEQVLENLIGNAIKFTETGGITVHAETDVASVTVRVTDTGVGISPENQSLLFRKFQQAGEDILARDVSQSTGLGLYISKLMMTAMGGHVTLEKSTPGKGSTFSFTLPTI